MWKYCLLLLCIVELSRCAVVPPEPTESTSESDSSTSESAEIETTTTANEETTTVTLKPPNEEAKLPVDLLSDDVLLDPNVVLARLSRRDLSAVNSKWAYQPYQPYQDSWNDYRRPIRRRYTGDYKQPVEPPKKFRVYPVFPGK